MIFAANRALTSANRSGAATGEPAATHARPVSTYPTQASPSPPSRGAPAPDSPARDDVLRPLERRVLRWRDNGVQPAEIAPRFKRGPAFMEQVERLAEYKLART